MASSVKFALQSTKLQSSQFPKINPVGWKNYEHESTRNPFTYPDGDLFRFRSDQLKKKKEEKQLVKNQKVHEKTTFASRAASRSVSVRKTISDADETVEHDEESFEKSLKSDPSWILSIAKRCSCDSKSVKDYITKKREMFLAQYTVAVKQEAIRTMEATALEEEKHINDSEKKLEEDTLAFEEFLKENDRNSIEALKMAEQETRIKLDKNAEIRHATGEMMSITSDIARNEEILKEFLMYEEFLRKLSPPDWQEQQYNKKIAHKAKKKEKEKKNRESVMFPALVKRSDSKSTRILSKADSVKELKSHTRQKSLPESKRSSTRSTVYSPLEDSDSEEEPEIYFSDPHQLLHIFTELEEQNLSLILNCQETHETLEEIRERSQIIQNKLKGKTDTLKEHREKLHMACIEQEEKAAQLELRSRLFCFGEFNSQEQDKLLDMLNQKISQVYQTCIGESETTISTINMLSSIERHIDELYEQLETVSRDILEAAQKTKKKERRLRLREEKLKMQLLHQEERLKRALARATADPKKQTGRRLMPRSAPPKTKEKTSEDDHTLRVQEEYRYFFTWQ
uniref:Coiled-coil domain-containing protein 38 isoform X2 n=1 Tax=Geotrypetes seraphini TaxID=260995 RepID=A0A6P8RPM1_GEOSA|nr:coiled-coil domain-containing protein 38 isoform X2 [Geotrypetes seraphini]XP_033807405.1 coiled-coil domain-containing protein 38 isoform X2 [Geotrypetes seraphini]XP_033807406.1 coiled-coil domain-containing protein 38 isoform X2 [Geotrypetes seraphini]XP_033807407.1 coiled-coil domain-containing protein 38 isoform X2 [Geotrypetes seraphini]XP_033807408.1 coiled-coil domain-containing protein 38 isoform X2 [Geotrypetes seraphini]XP_033807409.1 coiled-coil domain-containing protein 38 isof